MSTKAARLPRWVAWVKLIVLTACIVIQIICLVKINQDHQMFKEWRKEIQHEH